MLTQNDPIPWPSLTRLARPTKNEGPVQQQWAAVNALSAAAIAENNDDKAATVDALTRCSLRCLALMSNTPNLADELEYAAPLFEDVQSAQTPYLRALDGLLEFSPAGTTTHAQGLAIAATWAVSLLMVRARINPHEIEDHLRAATL